MKTIMFRFALMLLAAPALFGQLTTDVLSKAPPDIDEALRARISQFYQLEVDGKFRQAESLVAEDSKDFYYTVNKPKYFSFRITEIKYSDNFSKAIVMALCKRIVPIPGFMDRPLDVPTRSRWKVENGQWFWYVDKDEINMTPFGKMGPAPATAGNGQTTLPANIPSPDQAAAEAAKLARQVKIDKASVRLDLAGASSDRITVENHLPGAITLRVNAPKLEGLSIEAEPTSIKSGEKGAVVYSFNPGNAKPAGPVNTSIEVEQTGQILPVVIHWK